MAREGRRKSPREASAGLVTKSGLIQLIWDVGFACQWIDAFRGDTYGYITVFRVLSSVCAVVFPAAAVYSSTYYTQ